jgi:LmbE family N-acetylglucosaminyl deacetylase
MPLIEEAEALRRFRDRPRRVLAIFPHPDDEAYGPAGTLVMNARDGSSAVYIMTRGEASVMGRERGISPDAVAAIRRERLARVDALLGLDALLLGAFPDGLMARRPLPELAGAVGAALDAYAPEVVIAHDPRGVNAHPDHIATHWAIRAALATRPGIRLAMLAYLQELADAVAPRLLFATPEEEIDCVIALDAAAVEAKQRALDVHEAIVTLREDGSGRLLRPGIERYDFLGEDFDPPATDLFATSNP